MTYVVGADGKYETARSTGWDVKTDALNVAWGEVNSKIEAARQKVLSGEASPVLYFMEKRSWTFPYYLHIPVFGNGRSKTYEALRIQ
ncbi:hypothetical protein LWM68_42515 [Niabella sp. W65]|nr:hypothetical protein [Niabella sp. W65]MCH7368820.1 hypothetical protein [Niabella sp. W65]ULT44392.1 hypothetical protein KRR40_14205 [Niabella sp. I65]